MGKHFWGYRIDTREIDFFRKELQENRLRQGWGYDKGQDLRNLMVDQGAQKNLSIFKKVKKGDILLVPRCPNWNEVAIVEALDDFDTGYAYEISKEHKDYGHIFPARILKSFDRNNENISGMIRATIKNQSRFWNIDHCGTDIEHLITMEKIDLKSVQSLKMGFENAVADSYAKAFNTQIFENSLYENMTKKFSNEEWEFALVEGLRSYLPDPIIVERTGGISEAEHGTDILIRYPSLLGCQYLVAIQVKDYSGIVNEDPIKQINKSESYWNTETAKVIEKIVIVTKAKKEDNSDLIKNKGNVKVIFVQELKELLFSIGKSVLGIRNY